MEDIVKKYVCVFALALCAVLFFGACSKTASVGGAGKDIKPEIVYGLPDKMNGIFNPLIAMNGIDQNINRILFPSLLQADAEDNLIPYFAESFTVSDDGLILTFYLHKNAVWPNGSSVTAHDVYFTLASFAHPDFVGSRYFIVSNIAGAEAYHKGQADKIEGIEVIDDYTVKITFANVYAPALSNIGRQGILPEYVWGEVPPAEWNKKTELLNKPVGFGAYDVGQYETEQYLELIANEDYFLGAPKTPKIIIKYIKPDSIMAEFANGTIDIAPVKSLRKKETDSLIKEFGLQAMKLSESSYRYIGVNLRKKIFQDINLRKALVHAIDRKSVVELLLEGRAVVVDAPFMPSSWANPTGLESHVYDLELAQKYLKDGGYSDRNGDGILESPDGTPLKFTYKIVNDPVVEQVAVLYKESLRKIGIEIEIITFETNLLANEAIFNHDFDLYTLGCLIYIDADISGWWHSRRISNEKGVASWNFDAYANDIVDQKLDAALATFDQDERKACYQAAAEQINKDVPMIFLYIQDSDIVYNGKMEHFNPLTFSPYNDIEKWVIYD
jgi:peptide/nickel transport system substrate-binding protein